MSPRSSTNPAYAPRAESRRPTGSEWIKDHPVALEALYDITKRVIASFYPATKRVMGARLAERLLAWSEILLKGWLFNCQMCGQCILHSTGMTCPMNCPKQIRNGPCGGVRLSGFCEVIPEMRCIWVQAWERAESMRRYAEGPRAIQPPVNRGLRRTSAWANMVDSRDGPPAGWMPAGQSDPMAQANAGE